MIFKLKLALPWPPLSKFEKYGLSAFSGKKLMSQLAQINFQLNLYQAFLIFQVSSFNSTHVGIFQDLYTEDFEFKRNNHYRDFPPVLETSSLSQKIPAYKDFPKSLQKMTLSLNEKIPIRILQNPYRDDFEFERNNPYRVFPLYWRL